MKCISLCVLLLSLVACSSGTTPNPPVTTPNPPVTTPNPPGLPVQLQNFFPVGPDGQPVDTLQTWKARGANTLIRIGGGQDFSAWIYEAKSLGFMYVYTPEGNPADSIGDKNLLAWSQPDEPCPSVPASTIVSNYSAWKAADPSHPVLINLAPGLMIGVDGGCDAATNATYIAGSDWVSNDIYPVAGRNRPDELQWVGQALDAMAQISNGRPQFQYIETSEQDLPSCPQCPAPTPEQFRGEFWDAIVHNARGIWFFPEAISPFVWDNTAPDVAAELTTQVATVTALASVLQTAIRPSAISASVTSPLETTWRINGHQYFFVLNMSYNQMNSQQIVLTGTGSASVATVYGESRTVPIANGVITDNFGPHAIHIYQIN